MVLAKTRPEFSRTLPTPEHRQQQQCQALTVCNKNILNQNKALTQRSTKLLAIYYLSVIPHIFLTSISIVFKH